MRGRVVPKINICRSHNFHSYHCFATCLSKYLSSANTEPSGSIFSVLPVLSMRVVSPAARSNRKRNRRVNTCKPPPVEPPGVRQRQTGGEKEREGEGIIDDFKGQMSRRPTHTGTEVRIQRQAHTERRKYRRTHTERRINKYKCTHIERRTSRHTHPDGD